MTRIAEARPTRFLQRSTAAAIANIVTRQEKPSLPLSILQRIVRLISLCSSDGLTDTLPAYLVTLHSLSSPLKAVYSARRGRGELGSESVNDTDLRVKNVSWSETR